LGKLTPRKADDVLAEKAKGQERGGGARRTRGKGLEEGNSDAILSSLKKPGGKRFKKESSAARSNDVSLGGRLPSTAEVHNLNIASREELKQQGKKEAD